jgi:hypothetical protein
MVLRRRFWTSMSTSEACNTFGELGTWFRSIACSFVGEPVPWVYKQKITNNNKTTSKWEWPKNMFRVRVEVSGRKIGATQLVLLWELSSKFGCSRMSKATHLRHPKNVSVKLFGVWQIAHQRLISQALDDVLFVDRGRRRALWQRTCNMYLYSCAGGSQCSQLSPVKLSVILPLLSNKVSTAQTTN